ncbi:MAG: hypothetical protein EX272_12700 [Chromatiales bacterium]|nr:MAG: hypothetical protein EX272_12700 [Chromatiales bacterium]
MRYLNIAIAAVVFLSANSVQAADHDSGWTYRLTPYLWLPTIDGSLKYTLPPGSGGSPEISVGPTDWLDLINAGLLVSGTASKGRFSIYSDLVYLSMTSKNDGRVLSVDDTVSIPGTRIPIPISADFNLNTRTDLDGLAWSIAAGYELASTATSSVSGFVGTRYFGVDASSSWDLTAEITVPGSGVVLPAQGRIGSDVDLWDALIGVRGYFKMGDGRWSGLYHLDVGAGDSDLTWNAMAGLTYSYGWGDMVFAYRHLAYDQASDSLLQDFSFSGPGFGATFKFD